jgi:hypothetical protein
VKLVCSSLREHNNNEKSFAAMEEAQHAVGSIVDGVKKVAIGEKKPKAKKEKGGDGGADGSGGRHSI